MGEHMVDINLPSIKMNGGNQPVFITTKSADGKVAHNEIAYKFTSFGSEKFYSDHFDER